MTNSAIWIACFTTFDWRKPFKRYGTFPTPVKKSIVYSSSGGGGCSSSSSSSNSSGGGSGIPRIIDRLTAIQLFLIQFSESVSPANCHYIYKKNVTESSLAI